MYHPQLSPSLAPVGGSSVDRFDVGADSFASTDLTRSSRAMDRALPEFADFPVGQLRELRFWPGDCS